MPTDKKPKVFTTARAARRMIRRSDVAPVLALMSGPYAVGIDVKDIAGGKRLEIVVGQHPIAAGADVIEARCEVNLPVGWTDLMDAIQSMMGRIEEERGKRAGK